MLRKLELYGVDTTWFQAYLEGHTQSVTLRDPSGDVRTSKPLKNNIGTFQGSSLGPLLFSIFANDLSLYAEEAEVIQYADDTQVIISGDKGNIQAIIHRMEAVLGNIDAWFSANLLKVNASKAELIVFGSSRALSNMPELRISFCNTNIVPCDKVRNLGLIMDSKLSWDAHVSTISRRCMGILSGLSHARNYLPNSVVSTLVTALVLSQVRYCISVYGNGSKKNLDRIKKILNFAAKVIFW